MSDSEDVSLPVPARTLSASASVSLLSGFSGRASRKVDALTSTIGGRTGGSRRVQNSFTSNGSNGTGKASSGGLGGKVCQACGMLFTWRQRRHHCRACKKPVCDPCSKERLLIAGGDNKRHRVCHLCLKQHLASGCTREQAVLPQSAPTSIRSSPFASHDVSRNVSRDTSQHGPAPRTQTGLSITAEEEGEGEGADAEEAADAAVATAQAMAAAWTGVAISTGTSPKPAADPVERSEEAATESTSSETAGVSKNLEGVTLVKDDERARQASSDDIKKPNVVPLVLSIPSQEDGWGESRGDGGESSATTADVSVAGSAGRSDPLGLSTVPSGEASSGDGRGSSEPQSVGDGRGSSELQSVDDGAPTEETVPPASRRPPLGTGVRADPASHQHKRPVQVAKDQNPLALPWFTSKHVSPCSMCEDLWKVAWSAREDFLQDITKAESGKDYQLVASAGENVRLYAAGNMLWGGHAIRLRVEMEVAVPLGFAMRWLASLTARGGVYYPYSDTVACDIVEADSGALSVACAHWPTQLSGARRCTVMRYVSEDGSPPPGMEEAAAAKGQPPDPRPTIVFSTIDHPIMRDWASSGVDVEVFPSGLVLEEMDSSAGPVTKVKGLLGWDNKGALQHMAKMSYLSERSDRLEGLAQHLAAMERGYLEQAESEAAAAVSAASALSRQSTPGSASKVKAKAVDKAGGSVGGGGGGGAVTANNRASDTSSKESARHANSSPGSPPIRLSPLSPKLEDEQGPDGMRQPTLEEDDGDDEEDDYNDEEGGEDFLQRRKRMTSRATPFSPNRGRDLSGGSLDLDAPDSSLNNGLIRRKSESANPSNMTAVRGRVPSPAKAVELQAEVSFLNRQLAVRQSLEEKLRVCEAEKSRLITKLASTKADAARRRESLEQAVQGLIEKLTARDDQLASAQRKIGQVEQRALHAERNLELTRDALRVQADLAAATSASVAAAATLTLSPGTNSRFPVSKHDLPLASSPVLRAPPPARWGSGPVPAGGGVGDGDGAGTGVGDGSDNGLSRPGSSERGQSGAGAGMGGANGGVLVGRTQEMGVRFAMDTLRYSDDAEVVVFMLHLVQGLRHECTAKAAANSITGKRHSIPGAPLSRTPSGIAAPSSGSSTNSVSSVARALFDSTTKPPLAGQATPPNKDRRGDGSSEGLSKLSLLLISRACNNEEIANFLFWYLKLEAEADPLLRPTYGRVRGAFLEALRKKNAAFASALEAAEAYMAAISEVHGMIKKQGGKASKKTARLKTSLTENGLHVAPKVPRADSKHGATDLKSRGVINRPTGKPRSIPLPLDPRAMVVGLRPATAYTFPSAMSPCVVEFVLSDSVDPSFTAEDLLLEPAELGRPSTVSEISVADMSSWRGGPLPRAHSVSASASMRSMPEDLGAEEEDDVSTESFGDDGDEGAQLEGKDAAGVDGSVRRRGRRVLKSGTGGGRSQLSRSLRDGGEDLDEGKEGLLDRRRSSADVELKRGGTESAAEDDVKSKGLSQGKGTANRGGKQGKGGSDKGAGQSSALALQASSDLTELRLWEQMQVLGAASRERGSYLAIFKNGEDVRQDQLAVHMVSLMDRQLKEAGLDLRLKSYRVLATGLSTGMIEFVPGSVPMSAVLAKHNNSVLDFLRHHNEDPGGPLGMKREALDNFTRSCAGSCVVTYLLGVGDRHLDNLMLLPEGVLFHIDFGYLFGKDPKLMPPPFRLTREMVEAMGGSEAPHYTVFKSLCCQAYRQLRKSAHQYLNLLSLMSGAGIKDLSDDPASVLQLVQDRFKLDLTDEQADAHFLGLISQSVTALAPRVLEVMHQIRVAAR